MNTAQAIREMKKKRQQAKRSNDASRPKQNPPSQILPKQDKPRETAIYPEGTPKGTS